VEAVDFVRVREIRMAAAERGFIEHPPFTQGVELLKRVGA
jgi:hypothetical protein